MNVARSKGAPPLRRLAYPALAGRQGCKGATLQNRVKTWIRPQGLLGASACVPPWPLTSPRTPNLIISSSKI